jgi:hypothetical protein
MMVMVSLGLQEKRCPGLEVLTSSDAWLKIINLEGVVVCVAMSKDVC